MPRSRSTASTREQGTSTTGTSAAVVVVDGLTAVQRAALAGVGTWFLTAAGATPVLFFSQRTPA